MIYISEVNGLTGLIIERKHKHIGGNMKKLIVSLMLVLSMLAFSAESAASSTVGYVKYGCVTTAGLDLNFVALPLDAGFTTVSQIDAAAATFNQISYYDATNQGWVASTGDLFGWAPDFATEIGKPLMVNALTDIAWPGAKGGVATTKASPVASKGVSRVMRVSIVDAGSVAYDFSSDNDGVTFKAWIQERPAEIANESSFGAVFSMLGGSYASVAWNIGNFATAWSPGETFEIMIRDEQDGTHQKVYYEMHDGNITYLLDNDAGTISWGFEPALVGTGTPMVMDALSSIDGNMPLETKLEQNYPNPFNPTTTINFSLKSEGVVKLNVYNYTGQLVNSLVEGQMNAGYHTVNFDASSLSAGVY